MKFFISILTVLFASFSLFSQSGKLKKADNYFEKLAYSYAAPLYEELVGSEVDSPKMKGKLATSYYRMGDNVNAVRYFAQMINTSEATTEDYFNYAQSLKQTGNYLESDKWMARVNETSQADYRGISYMENTNYLEKIQKEGVHFEIKNLAVNTGSTDFGGYPTLDSKSAYFVSNRKKRIAVQNEWGWNSKRFLDLYKSTIASNAELTGEELITKKINTRFHEGPLCFTPDQKTVYFTRNNVLKGKKRRDQKGIQNLKLFKATINEDGKWVNEEELPFNSIQYSVGHPTITSDGKTLYFASDMPGGFGGADLYKVTINPDGSLGTPINLGKEVNTEGQEMFPWINAEGQLFFSSNGHVGLGGLDIFVLLPNKSGDKFKLVNAGKPLNSQNDDFAFSMNSTGTSGYFSSNRAEGKGDDDIYSYTLIKPFKVNLILAGTITDLASKEILPNAKVELLDKDGNTLETAFADQNGKYSFELDPEKEYMLQVSKDDYFDNSAEVSTVALGPNVQEILEDVTLEKDPGLSLYALVTDKKTGQPLSGVKMTLIDNSTSQATSFVTTETGDFRKALADKKLGDKGSYKLVLEKEGYFTKTVNYNTVFSKPGQYDMHGSLDLSMDVLVTDLADLVQINDIRFDLNKYNIRPDAAKELDKIVEVMNKYPDMVVELGSHTDCRASIAYNAKLSDNRAKASAAYIKARISNPSRIYGKGYGESKLLNGCACEGIVKSTCTEEEHQQNRRTEFRVISVGQGNVKVVNGSTNSF